jgi:hypothetical protein
MRPYSQRLAIARKKIGSGCAKLIAPASGLPKRTKIAQGIDKISNRQTKPRMPRRIHHRMLLVLIFKKGFPGLVGEDVSKFSGGRVSELTDEGVSEGAGDRFSGSITDT